VKAAHAARIRCERLGTAENACSIAVRARERGGSARPTGPRQRQPGRALGLAAASLRWCPSPFSHLTARITYGSRLAEWAQSHPAVAVGDFGPGMRQQTVNPAQRGRLSKVHAADGKGVVQGDAEHGRRAVQATSRPCRRKDDDGQVGRQGSAGGTPRGSPHDGPVDVAERPGKHLRPERAWLNHGTPR